MCSRGSVDRYIVRRIGRYQVDVSVDSRLTDISTIDRNSVDIPTDRKPEEQVDFLRLTVEEEQAQGFILSSNLLPLYGKLEG